MPAAKPSPPGAGDELTFRLDDERAVARANVLDDPAATKPTHPSLRSRVQAARHAVEVIRVLAGRDFTLNYRRSALGVLWSLLVPLAHLLVLVLVFQFIVPLKIDAYGAVVFSALLPWAWFSSCLGSAGGLFIANRDLMLRPNFVPLTLPVASMLSNLVTFLAAMPILFGVLFWYGRPVTAALLFFPLLVVIEGVLIVGLALIIASLNVFYRDVQYIVSVLLTLLFYLTPVFYRVQGSIAHYHIIYHVNPIAVLIRAYRAILFDGVAPSGPQLLFASSASVAVLIIGLLVYRAQEHDLLDSM